MRLIVISALVLTLLFSTLTYGVQEAEAINPIKGYVSSGGTTVAVEIAENGTATTTTPETKPVEEETVEDKDEDFETGEETATKAGQTVKDVVSETVKSVGTAVNDEIEETVEETVCPNTRCLIEKRQAEELKAWKESQGINEVQNVNGTAVDEDCANTRCLIQKRQAEELAAYELHQAKILNGTAVEGDDIICDSTACFMMKKHAQELKDYEDSLKSAEPQAVIYDGNGNVIEECNSTACFMKQRHAEEIRVYEANLLANSKTEKAVVVLDEDGNVVKEEICLTTACQMKKRQLAEQLEAGIDVGDCKDTACLIKRALGLEKEYKAPIYTQDIFTIKLSNTCIQAHKNNVTTICPTYEDLLQYDNTNHDISGKFVTDDNGFFHREAPKMDKHCKFYLPSVYSLVIVVDPDECWIKERGGFTIQINAIAPEDFKFKISDQFDVDRLRTIQKQDTRLLNEEQELKNTIKRLEDIFEARDDNIKELDEKLADFDKETRELYEEIGQNPDTVEKRKNERDILVKSLNNKSVDRQLRSYNTELIEARLDYSAVLEEKKALLDEQRSMKINSSLATVNGTYVFGVGRSFEECRNAEIGADIGQVADTINYMMDNCEGDPKNTITTELDKTPIDDLLQFTEYRFKAWFEKMSQACLGLCKEY